MTTLSGWHLLDLFSGCGSLSSAARAAGWRTEEWEILQDAVPDSQDRRWWLVSDRMLPCQDASRDLSLPHNIDRLVRNIKEHRYHWVHMGPPCTSFSRWFLMTCKTCSRTPQNPTGSEANVKERLGNLLARNCVRIAEACNQARVAWTIENPQSSYLWRLPEFVALARRAGVFTTTFPMCAYGCLYQKRTAFMSNARWVAGIAAKCTCRRRHERLQGRVRVGQRWVHRTALAAAYPPSLCQHLVSLAATLL